MNYIYDILINFNENLYDFYDWNLNDEIDHIRKIPVFKVDSELLFIIKNNEISLKSDFLDEIYNKTEVFTVKNIKNLKYACLFCDGMEAIGINVINDRVLKSKLLLDEEEEVIEFCERLKKQDIPYKVVKENIVNNYKTRKENEMEDYVKKQIISLNKENDIEKLRYLYYECFNKKETSKDKIIKDFNFEIKNNFDSLVNKLYNFFKLLQFNK